MKETKLRCNKGAFITKTNISLTDNYDILRKIGSGSSSKVYEVKSKITGELRACKQISKLKLENSSSKFQREIEILKSLDHPNIVKLYEYYETKRSIYLIMELCKGGDLLDKLITLTKNGKTFTEKDVSTIIRAIMSGIDYCHKKGISHRDINAENIIFLHEMNPNETLGENSLKIIDFGLSNFFVEKGGDKMKTKTASCYYISKEMLQGSYTEKCDIWSAGVLLYFLLSGHYPFPGTNQKEIISGIMQIKYSFLPENIWQKISEEAKDLIRHMITDESQRYNANQVLSHPWFTKCHSIGNNSNSSTNNNLNFDFRCFSEYKQISTFKKMTLLFISSRLNDNEVKNLQMVFSSFDKNNNGQINYHEFEQGLISCGKNKQEIMEMFKAIDTDGSGTIDYTEFMAACLDKKKYLKKEKLYEAFSAFDKDDSGKITKDDIMKVLKEENGNRNGDIEKEVNELMKKIDRNHDGFIDYKEFVCYFQGH